MEEHGLGMVHYENLYLAFHSARSICCFKLVYLEMPPKFFRGLVWGPFNSELDWEKIRASSYTSGADSCNEPPSCDFPDIKVVPEGQFGCWVAFLSFAASFFLPSIYPNTGKKESLVNFTLSAIRCYTGLAGLRTKRRRCRWFILSDTRHFAHHNRGSCNGRMQFFPRLALLSILVQYGSSLFLYSSLLVFRTLVRRDKCAIPRFDFDFFCKLGSWAVIIEQGVATVSSTNR
ncbi:hypothetical protein KSS87_004604 [Heliosperma pusillum]|nr:hypothetical protein KSS87_004604 [Heliosperma pusillum]